MNTVRHLKLSPGESLEAQLTALAAVLDTGRRVMHLQNTIAAIRDNAARKVRTHEGMLALARDAYNEACAARRAVEGES